MTELFEASPFPGPNAPMYDGCQNSTQPESNAAAGVQKWTSAGFSVAQLVLGVPSYGYLSSSSAQGLRQRRKARPRISSNGTSGEDVRLVGEDNTGQGQIMFRRLVEQGALLRVPPTDDTDKSTYSDFVGARGFVRSWDGCSSTPYLHSYSAQQTVSYDDPESLAMKAKFVSCVGMLGVNMFDTHGDTEQGDLIEAIRKGLIACRCSGR